MSRSCASPSAPVEQSQHPSEPEQQQQFRSLHRRSTLSTDKLRDRSLFRR